MKVSNLLLAFKDLFKSRVKAKGTANNNQVLAGVNGVAGSNHLPPEIRSSLEIFSVGMYPYNSGPMYDEWIRQRTANMDDRWIHNERVFVCGCDFDQLPMTLVDRSRHDWLAGFLKQEAWLYVCNDGPTSRERCHYRCPCEHVNEENKDQMAMLAHTRRAVSSVVLNAKDHAHYNGTTTDKTQWHFDMGHIVCDADEKCFRIKIYTKRKLVPESTTAIQRIGSAVATKYFLEGPHGVHLVDCIKKLSHAMLYAHGPVAVGHLPYRGFAFAHIVAFTLEERFKQKSFKYPRGKKMVRTSAQARGVVQVDDRIFGGLDVTLPYEVYGDDPHWEFWVPHNMSNLGYTMHQAPPVGMAYF